MSQWRSGYPQDVVCPQGGAAWPEIEQRQAKQSRTMCDMTFTHEGRDGHTPHTSSHQPGYDPFGMHRPPASLIKRLLTEVPGALGFVPHSGYTILFSPKLPVLTEEAFRIGGTAYLNCGLLAVNVAFDDHHEIDSIITAMTNIGSRSCWIIVHGISSHLRRCVAHGSRVVLTAGRHQTETTPGGQHSESSDATDSGESAIFPHWVRTTPGEEEINTELDAHTTDADFVGLDDIAARLTRHGIAIHCIVAAPEFRSDSQVRVFDTSEITQLNPQRSLNGPVAATKIPSMCPHIDVALEKVEYSQMWLRSIVEGFQPTPDKKWVETFFESHVDSDTIGLFDRQMAESIGLALNDQYWYQRDLTLLMHAALSMLGDIDSCYKEKQKVTEFFNDDDNRIRWSVILNCATLRDLLHCFLYSPLRVCISEILYQAVLKLPGQARVYALSHLAVFQADVTHPGVTYQMATRALKESQSLGMAFAFPESLKILAIQQRMDLGCAVLTIMSLDALTRLIADLQHYPDNQIFMPPHNESDCDLWMGEENTEDDSPCRTCWCYEEELIYSKLENLSHNTKSQLITVLSDFLRDTAWAELMEDYARAGQPKLDITFTEIETLAQTLRNFSCHKNPSIVEEALLQQ